MTMCVICHDVVFRLKSAELAFLEENCINETCSTGAEHPTIGNKSIPGVPPADPVSTPGETPEETGKATSCVPLIDALLADIRKRFSRIFADKQAIAAATLHPTFGSTWTSDAAVLESGMCTF